MLFVHIAESPSQAGNFREEVSPELDDLHLPVEVGLDDVLQHLVLTALTDDMEQSMKMKNVNIKTSSFSIKV